MMRPEAKQSTTRVIKTMWEANLQVVIKSGMLGCLSATVVKDNTNQGRC